MTGLVEGRLKCKKNSRGDLPDVPVAENLPSNAGDVDSIPAWGTKIPRDSGRLSLCSATTEPMHSRAWAPQLEKFHAPQ